MIYYTAIIDSAEDGGYGVTFPDAPGCTSSGASIDEATSNAAEALRDWAEVMDETGNAVPKPRSLGDIQADPDVRALISAGACMVAIPLTARYGRVKRVQLTMDEGTLAAIDAAAAATNETRSGFIARVALDAAASQAGRRA